MVKIIEHNDYNAPVDDKNIVEIADKNSPKNSNKAFKVLDSIWIVPTPKLKEVDHTTNKIFAYDENYCNTVAEKTLFIKETTQLLKRINTTQSGEKLLDLLSNGLPLSAFPEKNNFLNYRNSIVTIKRNNKLEKVPASVIISPLQGDRSNFHADTIGVNSPLNLLISWRSCIYYASNIAHIAKDQTGNVFVVDPAISLQHELVHALHSNYGLRPFIDSPTEGSTEEKVTFGGMDRTEVDNHIKCLDSELRKSLEHTAEEINRRPYSKSQKEYFARKYLFEKKDGRYVVTDKGFNFFRYFMRDAFSEYNFTLELGLKTRSDYYQGFFSIVETDILNKEQYSIEKGFTKGIHIRDNNLMLPKDAKMLNEKREIIPIENIGACSSRSKRSISELKEIPLEDEFLDSDRQKVIQKRSACNLETLLEDFDTIENRMLELPKKLLANTHSEEIKINMDKIVQNKVNDHSSFVLPERVSLELDQEMLDFIPDKNIKDENIKIVETSCKSTVELVKLNQSILKDKENAHRYNKNIDYKEKHIEFNTESLNENMNRGDVSHTHSKYFPKTMSAVHKTTTALQLFDILSTIKNDFTVDKDSKDTLHKINDVAQATPFVASALEGLRIVKAGSVAPMLGYAAIALNLGVDIYDKNYVGLAEDIGIFILLEAFPELTLPLLLFGYIKQWLENIERRKQIKNSIIKLLAQSNEYIDISAINMEKNWAKSLYNKIHVSVDSIEKQLIYNAEAFVHNIKHKIHNVSGSEKDKEKLKLKLLSIERKIWNNIDIVRKSILNILYGELSKVFIDNYKKVSLKQMSSLSEDTKQAVKDILSERDPAINDSFIKECLDQMDTYIKEHDIGKKLDMQIKQLQNMVGKGKQNIQDENIPTSCITVVNNKITDTICNKIINSKSQIKEGRRDKSFTIDNEVLRISNDVYTNININHNFTISFWIKLPKGFIVNNSQAVSLIREGINHNQGWELGLKNGKLYYSIYVDEKNKVTLESLNNIPINKWTKITISNKRSLARIIMYINTKKNTQHNYTRNYHIEEHKVNNKAIIFCSSLKDINCEISEFKTYYKKFNINNVISSYHKDFNQDILYDDSGEPLKTDREYYLVNKSLINYYYQISEDLKLVLLEEKPKIKLTVAVKGKEEIIQDKEVVQLRLNNQILGLKIAALQAPNVSYTIYEEQIWAQSIQQISRLWVSSDKNKTTKTLKLFSLKDFFIYDKYDYSALGIITPDAEDKNMSGVFINFLDKDEGAICMSTSTYLSTAVKTSMNSNIIPIVKPILERGRLEGNELIEAMSFYFVRKD